MSAISVHNLSKSFGTARAVRDVSFDVFDGEIFGLLGPNGAGKTTTIRMILDIIRPDHGEISVLGGKLTGDAKDLVGYLPEERGLYKDVSVENVVLYLAELKGVARGEARARATSFFEALDLGAHRRKKVQELSKGMQQKVQIISTLIHRPKLIIIDEPFSGLDPVNARLVQDLLLRERANGTTIVMSTHQMYQVEEMCNRLVLINRGERVLYGAVDEIRRRFSDDTVRILARGELPPLLGAVETSRKGNARVMHLVDGCTPQQLLRQLADAPGFTLDSFEVALPSMDDIFVRVVAGDRGALS